MRGKKGNSWILIRSPVPLAAPKMCGRSPQQEPLGLKIFQKVATYPYNTSAGTLDTHRIYEAF